MNPRLKKRLRLPAVCYLAGLAIYLVVCGISLIADKGRADRAPTAELNFDAFEAASIERRDDAAGDGVAFASTDADPQLVYRPGERFFAGRVVFRARADRPCGEIVLYYTTEPDEPFSEAKKLWAQAGTDGNWYFDLGGRSLAALRIDPDSRGGVVWDFRGVTLNAPRSWQSYFVPDGRDMLLLLGLPCLAAAAFVEVANTLRPLLVRRRFARQAAHKPAGDADG